MFGVRVFIIGVAVAAATLAASVAMSPTWAQEIPVADTKEQAARRAELLQRHLEQMARTSDGKVPRALGVECRGEFVVLGLLGYFAIRRSAVLGVNVERNHDTGEFMYGLITFNGHKGLEQLIVGVDDLRPIIECVGN